MAKTKKKRGRESDLNGVDHLATSNKRTRRIDDEAVQLASLYDALASEDKEERLLAAEKLVQIYHKKLDASIEGSFANLIRPLSRLTRGLCSNRKAARMGFYAALSEILHLLAGEIGCLETDSAEKYLELVEKTTKLESQVSKQETRDHLLGYVLANEALLQEKLLLGPKVAEPLLREVVGSICKVAQRHSWLREECGLALYRALNRVKQKDHGSRIARLILEVQHEHSITKTPEGVAVWLQAIDMNTSIPRANQIWHHGNPLSLEELSKIAMIMKQGHADTGDSKGSSVEKWNSLNFGWDVIFSNLLSKSDQGQDIFHKFWKLSVHDIYFNVRASAEMKYRGFQILDHLIRTGPPWALKQAFSTSVVQRLINQSSKSERFLHDAALRVLSSIVDRGQKDAQAGLCIVQILMSPPGGVVDFDKRTGTKTVQKLCTSIKPSEFEHNLLPSLIQQDTEHSGYFYQCVADLYLNVTRSLISISPAPSSKLLSDIISSVKSLARYGFVKYHVWNRETKVDENETHLPVLFYSTFRARFFTCLSQVLSLQGKALIPQILDIPIAVQHYGSENIVPLVAADSGILDSLSKAEITYRELVNTFKQGSNRPVDAMALFFSVTLLRVYNGEEDAVGMLDDLQETAQDMIRPKNPQTTQKAIHSLVELILSSLSVPSALSRKVADRVFAALSHELTADGLNLLTNPLLEKTPLVSAEDLADTDAEDSPDSDDSISSSPSSSSGGNSDEDISSNQADGSDTHADEMSDSDASEEARFNALLAETLNAPRTKSNEESSDGSDSSDEESMDDEQMMKLEPHLTAIFRERRAMFGDGRGKRAKMEKKRNLEQNTNFKNRVLDLLLIFVKEQHDSDLGIAEIILPVLKFLGTTPNRQSAGKASDLLRQYFDTARTRGMPNCNDRSMTLRIMHNVHEEALKCASKQHATACSRASLFLAKVLIGKDSEDHALVMKRYADTAHAAFKQGSKLPSSFLTDGMNWSHSLRS